MWDLQRIGAGSGSATIVDVSRNGMRLESRQPFREGTQVAVDFKGMVACGAIRYCEALGAKFVHGIKVNLLLDPIGGASSYFQNEEAMALR